MVVFPLQQDFSTCSYKIHKRPKTEGKLELMTFSQGLNLE
jgi:hypothetical protein